MSSLEVMETVDDLPPDLVVEEGPEITLHKTYPLAIAKPKFNRPISPYICSTFEDFQLEREFLNTKVFPKINDLCRERGTYFSPNDFKHCVKESEQPHLNWDLLRLGLTCIDDAIPFFMCLLGERYGTFRAENLPQLPTRISSLTDNSHWLDRNYLLAAEGGYKWVLNEANQNCSLVELEIIEAAFLNDSEFCCFYFRQPEHLDDLLNDLPKSEHQAMTELYQSESEVAKLKIEDLKNRIVKRGLPVKYFCSLEDLGDIVMEDWTIIIDKLHPPLNFSLINNMDCYWERAMHDKFASTRRDLFCQTDHIKDLLEMLTKFADSCTDQTHVDMDTERSKQWKRPLPFELLKKKSPVVTKYKSILLLSGERGCGKSSLISNWLERYDTGIHDYELIYHFVGSSQRSYDITNFLRQVIHHMQKHVLAATTDKDIGTLTLRDLTNFKYLCNTFASAIALGPCVLVIDGVDELGGACDLEANFIKEFLWLPECLPPQCKVIITTSVCDWTYKSLLKRTDVCRMQMNEFHDPVLRDEYLNDKCPELKILLYEGNALDLFEHCRLVQNPLFLNLLIGELNDTGVHHRLEDHLKTYLEESISIRDFTHHMVRRWIKKMSWSVGTDWDDEGHEAEQLYGWVAESLRLLCVSRNGLTKADILDCLVTMKYTGDMEVTSYHWMMFRMVLKDILYERPHGLLAFSHQHVKECLEFSLFGAVTPAAVPLVRSFALLPTIHDLDQKPYHKILADHMMHSKDLDRRLYELPYHLEKSHQTERLREFITEEKTFMAHMGNGKNSYLNEKKLDLIHYINGIHDAGWHKVGTCLHVISAAGVGERRDALEKLASRLAVPVIVTHLPSKSKGVPETDSVNISQKSDYSNTDDSNQSKSKSRATFQASSNYMPSLASIGTTTSAISFTNDESHRMAGVCTSIGQLLYEFGSMEVALDILTIAFDLLFHNFPLSTKEQLQIVVILEYIGRVNRTICNNNAAERSCRKSLEYLLEQFDDEGSRHLDPELIEERLASKGRLYKNLGAILVDDGSEESLADAHVYLKEACIAMEQNQLETAAITHHVGCLRVKEQEFTKAEACFQQAINIRRTWYGTEHPTVADTMMELANILNDPSNKRGYNSLQAEMMYRETLKIREKMLGKEHLKVGLALFALGRLLKDEETKTIKREGVDCFKRATDIFVCRLGPNHKTTKEASLYFYWLQKSIQMGEYIYGPARPKDMRTLERPFSAMSYHDRELLQIKQSIVNVGVSEDKSIGDIASQAYSSKHSITSGRFASSKRVSTTATKSIEQSSRVSRPTEQSSRTSVSSTSQKPIEGPAIRRASLLPKTGVQRDLSRGKYKTNPLISVAEIESRMSVSVDETLGEEHHSKESITLSIEPSAIEQLVQRPQGRLHYLHYYQPRHNVLEKYYKRNLYASIKAMQDKPSKAESRYRAHGVNCHSFVCKSPGPFDNTTKSTRVTFGPNTTVGSLLGPKPCPRVVGTRMHHKAAWYHVPGRYPTVHTPHPPKRNQSRSPNPRVHITSDDERTNDNQSPISHAAFNIPILHPHHSREVDLFIPESVHKEVEYSTCIDSASIHSGHSKPSHSVQFLEGF